VSIRHARLVAMLGAAWLASACTTVDPDHRPVPRVDYHQHLVSRAFAPIVKRPERDGAALIRELDEAGVRRAVVLSVGYSFADERKALPDPDRLTREENDWTSDQIARHAGRLIGFCSANPLRQAALAELERCLRLPDMVGIKVHMGNSGVSLHDPIHVGRMKQLFALAERLRAPIIIHLRPRSPAENYGPEDARIFIEQLLPDAPDIEVVVAHLAGTGPGYPEQTDRVMAAFAKASLRHDPRMRNVYFDVATDVAAESTPEEAALVALRIRQIGVHRILYGSDLTPPGGKIRAGWEIFRTKVPLTKGEMRRIATNRTRFAR
jgi:predicted TIM-barrel fold metal-dependent hydrolase